MRFIPQQQDPFNPERSSGIYLLFPSNFVIPMHFEADRLSSIKSRINLKYVNKLKLSLVGSFRPTMHEIKKKKSVRHVYHSANAGLRCFLKLINRKTEANN